MVFSKNIFFSSSKFFNIILDPDPNSMYLDPQHHDFALPLTYAVKGICVQYVLHGGRGGGGGVLGHFTVVKSITIILSTVLRSPNNTKYKHFGQHS